MYWYGNCYKLTSVMINTYLGEYGSTNKPVLSQFSESFNGANFSKAVNTTLSFRPVSSPLDILGVTVVIFLKKLVFDTNCLPIIEMIIRE